MRARDLLVIIGAVAFLALIALAPYDRAEEPHLSLADLHSAQPNDCAITASIASARLTKAGVWNRMLRIGYLDETGAYCGHMLTVWQPRAGGHIFVYDDFYLHCSRELLSVRGRNPLAIAQGFLSESGCSTHCLSGQTARITALTDARFAE